jgi:NAD(P)-dependent dehydrogenase (short-subunit alcohol dehydrogenase family)
MSLKGATIFITGASRYILQNLESIELIIC